MSVFEELQRLSFEAKATIAIPAIVAGFLWTVSEIRHAAQRRADQQRIGRLDAGVIREKELERDNARRAITSEIDANLTQLRSLFDDLWKPLGRIDRRPASEEILGAIRLAQLRPIRWQRLVWEERAVQTAGALSAEEFAVVSAFYDQLNRLDQMANAVGTPWHSMAGTWNLYDDGKRAWDEYQRVARHLLEDGNPIAHSAGVQKQ